MRRCDNCGERLAGRRGHGFTYGRIVICGRCEKDARADESRRLAEAIRHEKREREVERRVRRWQEREAA